MHRRHFLGAAAAAAAIPSVATGAPAFEPNLDTVFGFKLNVLHTPRPAPALPILMPERQWTKMTSYPGEVVVAMFWATWCHVCHGEMPIVDALNAEVADEGVRVLPISLDYGEEALETVATYYDRRGISSLDVMIDGDHLNAQQLGLRGTPTTFFLNKSGEIVSAIESAAHLDTDEARRYLRHLVEA